MSKKELEHAVDIFIREQGGVMDWKEIEGKIIGRGYEGYEELLISHVKEDEEIIFYWTKRSNEQVSNINKLEAENQRLREAIDLLKSASTQSHDGHWDKTGQHGAGCPECIRARELREKAKTVLEQKCTCHMSHGKCPVHGSVWEQKTST